MKVVEIPENWHVIDGDRGGSCEEIEVVRDFVLFEGEHMSDDRAAGRFDDSAEGESRLEATRE